MGHRNIQFNSHMIDLQADQGHSHLHPEQCIVYTNLPNYPQPPPNINFHPIPERHDNPLFYSVPPYNLDLNVPPPSSHYNPYFPVQVNHGAHNMSYGDGVRGSFKRKNAEVGSSSSVGPMAMPTESDMAPEYARSESMVESGSRRSVGNRAGVVGPDSVVAHNNNLMQGNYVAPPVQLPANPWLDMNFGANNGDFGALAWGQPPNLPYVHANVNGACVEGGNIGAQGYQLPAINRGAGFVHAPIAQAHPTPAPPMQGVRGYNNVNHLSQMATSSGGVPMIRYSNTNIDPFQDVVDAGHPAFLAPAPPTGFQMYRAHRGEILIDPNARHLHNLPHLRVLPEDEIAMLEIPGYHVEGEAMDQLDDMRLDIDHMSYEELLELGEQIGSVGTGLSDEFIKKYMKVRRFTSVPACINLELAPCPDQEMIDFCVVCQNDYELEESIGTLDCGHEYHRECIKRWLLVKNTCPVCKCTALRGKGKNLEIDGRYC